MFGQKILITVLMGASFFSYLRAGDPSNTTSNVGTSTDDLLNKNDSIKNEISPSSHNSSNGTVSNGYEASPVGESPDPSGTVIDGLISFFTDDDDSSSNESSIFNCTELELSMPCCASLDELYFIQNSQIEVCISVTNEHGNYSSLIEVEDGSKSKQIIIPKSKHGIACLGGRVFGGICAFTTSNRSATCYEVTFNMTAAIEGLNSSSTVIPVTTDPICFKHSE